MPTDRFMIAPLESGIRKDLEPWLIPDDAFEQLNNAYVFRGKIKKRFGSRLSSTNWSTNQEEVLFSRLKITLPDGPGEDLGTTDINGNATGTVPGAVFKVGQMFSIGTELFTVQAAGKPVAMMRTGSTTLANYHTYDAQAGDYGFEGATPNTQIYFYPSEPVMGLAKYGEGYITNQDAYAFDTQFAYKFSGGSWTRVGDAVWHGDNSDFMWSTIWTGITANLNSLFVSNFNAARSGAPGGNDDPLKTFDGSTWADFSPKFLVAGAGNIVKTARIIIPFKDRLLLLNTIESNEAGTINFSFVNRCRYSQNGSPFATGAWYEKNQTGYLGGGYIDCPTRERITGAEFIKDRLIVYFERSTWELAYTGNQILPFVWQKINTELGADAPFGVVAFDKVILALGDTGVHACNGANVERIDFNIPDEIFKVKNEGNDFERVAGIRDYVSETVYWSMMTDTEGSDKVFPDRVLVYNYKTGSWALNDDVFTCFGYFEQQDDWTWQSTNLTWGESDETWGSGVIQSNFRKIIAGNHQGFVLTLGDNIYRNAPSMSIINMSNVITGITVEVLDHTLDVGDYVRVENTNGIVVVGGSILQVNAVTDDNNVILDRYLVGTYTGGGTLARVSQIDIMSKQWNPYISQGKNVYLSKIDFCVEKTTEGEITVDYFPSSSNLSMVNEAFNSMTLFGTNVLGTAPYTLVGIEATQTRLWHSVYFQGEGECVQIRMYLNDEQMRTIAISQSAFQLEGLILHTNRRGDL